MQRWRIFLWLLGAFFLLSELVGAGGYWFLHHICGQADVFGSLWVFRMFPFHRQHSMQYIAVVALSYSVTAALWGTISSATGSRRHLEVMGVLGGTLIFSSIAGGMLYEFHNMQSGYFPPWARQQEMFAEGARQGILVGWFIVLISAPLSFVAVPFAYLTALYLPLRFHLTPDNSPLRPEASEPSSKFDA